MYRFNDIKGWRVRVQNYRYETGFQPLIDCIDINAQAFCLDYDETAFQA